jgi:hypothetical protein
MRGSIASGLARSEIYGAFRSDPLMPELLHSRKEQGMKLLIAMTVAVAGAAASYFAPSPAEKAGIDPMKTAAVGTPSAYSVSNIAENRTCLLKRNVAASTRTFRVEAEPGCKDVWPSLPQARNWTRNADGSVALTDKAGKEILTLAEGDGIAYVSINPPSSAITLTSAD